MPFGGGAGDVCACHPEIHAAVSHTCTYVNIRPPAYIHIYVYNSFFV